MDELPFSPIVVGPSTIHAHTHTVVFLHGRGDRAQSFADSLAFWRDTRGYILAEALPPTVRWVFPQAPMRTCASLVQGPGGGHAWPQWFDVWDVRDFAAREELQAKGLREVVPAMQRLLAAEAARLDGRWERVVLAGISMGGATSVHTLANLDQQVCGGRLGALLGFSSRCPFAGRTLADLRDALGLSSVADPADNTVLRNTPVLLEHCVDDPLVLVQNGRRLRDILRSYGAQVTWKEYSSGGHWLHAPDGMEDAVAFLYEHVPGLTEADAAAGMDIHVSADDDVDDDVDMT